MYNIVNMEKPGNSKNPKKENIFQKGAKAIANVISMEAWRENKRKEKENKYLNNEENLKEGGERYIVNERKKSDFDIEKDEVKEKFETEYYGVYDKLREESKYLSFFDSVESTKEGFQKYKNYLNLTEILQHYFPEGSLEQNGVSGMLKDGQFYSFDEIAEMYHRAKENDSNPELVFAVEVGLNRISIIENNEQTLRKTKEIQKKIVEEYNSEIAKIDLLEGKIAIPQDNPFDDQEMYTQEQQENENYVFTASDTDRESEEAKQPENTDNSESEKEENTFESENVPEDLKNEWKGLNLKFLKRMNMGEGVKDLESELDNFQRKLDKSSDFEGKTYLQEQINFLKKEIYDFYTKSEFKDEAKNFDEEKEKQREEKEGKDKDFGNKDNKRSEKESENEEKSEEKSEDWSSEDKDRKKERRKKSGNKNKNRNENKSSKEKDREESDDSKYRFVYEDFKYGDGDERFRGEKKFLDDENFTAKDQRNAFSKNLEKKKDNKERVKIKRKYNKVVKSLNENYFKKLLGEKRIQELRRFSGEDKKAKEKEMLKDILSTERDPVKRKIIEQRLEKREAAEEYIKEKDAKIRERVDLRRKRRSYSKLVEAEINRTKTDIKELKEDKTLYDKEVHKLLKTKLEMLRKVEREKENKISKFTREQLEKRKKRLESPEMEAVFEKYKEDFINNLKDMRKKAWTGGTAILTKPLIGLWGGLSALSPSKAFIGFFEGLGVGLVEGVPDLLQAVGKLFNIVAVIPIKAFTRYAAGK